MCKSHGTPSREDDGRPKSPETANEGRSSHGFDDLAVRIGPKWHQSTGRELLQEYVLNHPNVQYWPRAVVADLVETCRDGLYHFGLREALDNATEDEWFVVLVERTTEKDDDGWTTVWTTFSIWQQHTMEFLDVVFEWRDYPPRDGDLGEKDNPFDWEDPDFEPPVRQPKKYRRQ